MAGHVVLIGDSILDNAPYVDRDHDVTSHLKRELPGDWQVTLRAVDGSSLPHIPTQTIDLPDSTTHIVFSCGGNDALNHIDILDRPTRSVGSALRQLNRIRTDFFQEYSRVLRSLADTELPVIVLTILALTTRTSSKPPRRRSALLLTGLPGRQSTWA